MSDHLELRVKIKTDNLADSGIRKLLYGAFAYDAVLAREDELRAEYFELARIAEQVPGVRDATFAENRIRHFRQDFFSQFPETHSEKLLYFAQELKYYGHLNEQPRVLLDVVAPEFFKIFPKGEIWFVELNRSTQREIWNGENKLLKTYSAASSHIDDNAYEPFKFRGSPHEMSGLEGGLSAYLWLQLMMFCFYPFVNGVISSPDARLLFLLLPDRAINALKEYRFDLYRETELDLSDIYSDSINTMAGRGIKSHFPEDAAVLSATRYYFEWYIRRCSALLAQLLGIHDVKRRFITTLTLNRLAVDTRIIETSELPYLMKLLFFGVVDKYANLYVQLGLEHGKQETAVWKTLLTGDFYEDEIKSALQAIPGRVGEELSYSAEWIFQHLENYGPHPEVIRELRNSYHGYGLRQIDKLLSHPGELHNDVPTLSNILWHWLLAKGLPQASILTCA